MVEWGKGPWGRGYRLPGQQNRRIGRPLLERVNLMDIDRRDELFSMTFEPNLGRLKASVEQMGILEPIWLRRKGPGFQIISGFRRFDVAHRLGKGEIGALVWKRDGLADQLAFQMSLHGNILGRGLNLVEKSLVLEKLLNRFSVGRDEVIRRYLPLLGFEPNERVLENLLLIETFSIALKRYLLSHGLSLSNILLIGKFSEKERESICTFLSPLRVGENVLKEILTFLREISQRDGIGINDLLSCSRIQDALSDSRASGPEKIRAVRRLLREKRYPTLSQLEKRFRSWRKGMRFSPQVTITPPPFFEGDRFRIEFYFESLEGYDAILGELQTLSRENIKDLLRIKGYVRDPI